MAIMLGSDSFSPSVPDFIPVSHVGSENGVQSHPIGASFFMDRKMRRDCRRGNPLDQDGLAFIERLDGGQQTGRHMRRVIDAELP